MEGWKKLEEFLEKSTFFNKLGTKICSLALLGQSLIPFSSFYVKPNLTPINISPVLEQETLAEIQHIEQPLSESKIATAPIIALTPKTSTSYSAFNSFPQNPGLVTSVSTPTFNLASDFSIINPEPVPSPAVDAGYGIKQYGEKFLYAHSTLAFASLKYLYPGNKIYIESNGVGSYYTVSRREVFSRSELDTNSSRRSALYRAQINGQFYDYALMTCGNGQNDDENYRLVLFLTEI